MAGVKKIGQYRLGETLGAGSFGKVKRAEHVITGHVVAVKILNREQVKNLDMVGKIKREIQILKLFQHPHIIKLYQVISSPTDIFMMMEYVSGGELFEYILKHGKLEEQDARKFFQQIISGVDYCHRHMVVHRDLKPENLLLDSKNNVKIADFGLSNIMTDGHFLKTSCGSPNYAAPEVISGLLYAGPEVDVWSCGVILYVLLCGKLPFDDDYVPYLFKKIKNGIYTIPEYLSKGSKDLTSAMLQVDPLQRITIAQIREHPWFVVDLPEYLFPDNSDENGNEFDDEAVTEICQRFQVFPDHVLDMLRTGDNKNQILIAYRLILDNRKIAAHGHHLQPEEEEVSNNLFASSAGGSAGAGGGTDRQLGSEIAALFGGAAKQPPKDITIPPPSQGSAPPPAALSPKSTGGRWWRSKADKNPSSSAQKPMPSQTDGIRKGADPGPVSSPSGRTVRRARWHLGMRSQNSPCEVMQEVYRAMQSLNFQWKVVTPFHARCRCWNQVSGTMVKMSLQLYSTADEQYLLDFQSLPTLAKDHLKLLQPGAVLGGAVGAVGEGTEDDDGVDQQSEPHTLEFFELCAMVIAELGK
eukprot:m.371567 g.371567  ORF g.371567 m.371567 type:complete len:583 (+) comp20867_c0_seq8:275-2023(+)